VRDEGAEVALGEDRVEDLRVQVREGGRLVTGLQPVALDSDDARGAVEGGGERDVWVWVREAGVGGAPGVIGGGVGGGGGGGGGGGVGAEGGVAVGRVGGAGRDGGLMVVVVALLKVQALVFSRARVFCSSADVVGPLCRPAVAEIQVGLGAFHAGPEPRLSSRRSREAYARPTTALATADDTPFQTQWLRRALPTTPSLLR